MHVLARGVIARRWDACSELESLGMRYVLVAAACLAAWSLARPASAQSLFVQQGERAVDVSAGWSVGPFSNGVEIQAGGSVDGRWDIAFGVNRYSADFGGDDDTTFSEWSPSARYFFHKEQDDGTPVSLALHTAFFQGHYEGEGDGWYGLLGGQLFKRLELVEAFVIYPYVGFSLAAESYSFGGAEAERTLYITRQFGVHGLMPMGARTWLRVTVEEHSFRRETYRAARVGIVRRF
jgi:hypothetical protein